MKTKSLSQVPMVFVILLIESYKMLNVIL